MMYLDMVISAAKQFAKYKGTSNDPVAQYLLAGLRAPPLHTCMQRILGCRME